MTVLGVEDSKDRRHYTTILEIVGGEEEWRKYWDREAAAGQQAVLSAQCYPWDVPGGSQQPPRQSSQAWADKSHVMWRLEISCHQSQLSARSWESNSHCYHYLPPSLPPNYLLFLSLSHVIWRNWQWSSRELGINCFLHFAPIMKVHYIFTMYSTTLQLYGCKSWPFIGIKYMYIGHW